MAIHMCGNIICQYVVSHSMICSRVSGPGRSCSAPRLLPLLRGGCFESLVKVRTLHFISGRRISVQSEQTGKYFLLPLRKWDFIMCMWQYSVASRRAMSSINTCRQAFHSMCYHHRRERDASEHSFRQVRISSSDLFGSPP